MNYGTLTRTTYAGLDRTFVREIISASSPDLRHPGSHSRFLVAARNGGAKSSSCPMVSWHPSWQEAVECGIGNNISLYDISKKASDMTEAEETPKGGTPPAKVQLDTSVPDVAAPPHSEEAVPSASREADHSAPEEPVEAEEGPSLPPRHDRLEEATDSHVKVDQADPTAKLLSASSW